MLPMSRKIIIKKVAGFHSFDFGFLDLTPGVLDLRNGLGIREAQNEREVMLGMVEYPRGRARAGR